MCVRVYRGACCETDGWALNKDTVQCTKSDGPRTNRYPPAVRKRHARKMDASPPSARDEAGVRRNGLTSM